MLLVKVCESFASLYSVGIRMGEETKISRHLLYADDNADSCELVLFMLQEVDEFDFKITFAESAAKAMQFVQQQQFDVVVLDQYYPDSSGIDVCRFIREIGLDTPVIFYTGDVRDDSKQAALDAGAQFYFTKPNDLTAVIDAIVEVASM